MVHVDHSILSIVETGWVESRKDLQSVSSGRLYVGRRNIGRKVYMIYVRKEGTYKSMRQMSSVIVPKSSTKEVHGKG